MQVRKGVCKQEGHLRMVVRIHDSNCIRALQIQPSAVDLCVVYVPAGHAMMVYAVGCQLERVLACTHVCAAVDM